MEVIEINYCALVANFTQIKFDLAYLAHELAKDLNHFVKHKNASPKLNSDAGLQIVIMTTFYCKQKIKNIIKNRRQVYKAALLLKSDLYQTILGRIMIY